MNKERFNDVVTGDLDVYADTVYDIGIITPNNWSRHKEALLKFVESVDEVVEVYNMENKENK